MTVPTRYYHDDGWFYEDNGHWVEYSHPTLCNFCHWIVPGCWIEDPHRPKLEPNTWYYDVAGEYVKINFNDRQLARSMFCTDADGYPLQFKQMGETFYFNEGDKP